MKNVTSWGESIIKEIESFQRFFANNKESLQARMLNASCPLCNSYELEDFFTCEDGFKYQMCHCCSHVFANPILTLQERKSIFDEITPQIVIDYCMSEEGKKRDSERFAHYFRIVQHHLPRVNPKHALDVGCGTGGFIHFLNNRGLICEGVEFFEQFRQCAKQYTGCNVLAGAIEQVELEKNRYAFVSLIESLEHMIDPSPILLKLHNSMVVGGVLLVTVPSGDDLFLRLMRDKYNHRAHDHIHLFTKKSLMKVVQDAKFKVISVRSEGRGSVSSLINYVNCQYGRLYTFRTAGREQYDLEATPVITLPSFIRRFVGALFWIYQYSTNTGPILRLIASK